MPEIPRSSLPVSSNLPQPREVVTPDFTSNVYVPVSGQLTGAIDLAANMLAAWTPVQTRFVLRGGYIMVHCTTDCAGTPGPARLNLFDNSVTNLVLPLGLYDAGTTKTGDIV